MRIIKNRTCKCTQCGAVLPEERRCGMYICDECAGWMGFQPKLVPKRDFPESWTMDDKIDKANELGLSYGNFVALVHDGTLNIAELTKLERAEGSRRKPRSGRVVRIHG